MKKFFFLALFFMLFAACSNTNNGNAVKILPDDDPSGNDADYDTEQTDDTDGDSVSDEDNGDTAGDDDTDQADSGDSSDTAPDTDKGDTDEKLEYESGFIALEGVDYTLNYRSYQTGKAMMWYNFQPADEDPREKPLFVLYNGGPGSSSALLFLYNTAKKTGDQLFSGEGSADNETSWTQFGNLLYVDARQTGFSYGIIDDPENAGSRDEYFTDMNFNIFADAGDFIRVILRFMEKHPSLKANPVVLAGESYGGTRSTTILNVLLNVADYAQEERIFYDETLFDEIAAHFQKIDPSVKGMPSKEVVAKQFGRQILIQPLIAGQEQFNAEGELLEQSDSPLYIIGEETGRTFKPCGKSCDRHTNALIYVQRAGRDYYAYRKPSNWLFDYTDVGTAKMLQMPMFEEFILNDPTKIAELHPENRIGAFRGNDSNSFLRNSTADHDFEGLPEIDKIILRSRIAHRNAKPLSSGNLDTFFGELPDYDDYFVDLNQTINITFSKATVSHYDTINGEMFLENIRTVKTFITQAEEDIIIYSKGIPASLKSFSEVSSVDTEENSFTVNFSDGQSVLVTFPFYPESSHSVSVNQPEKLFNDVKNWMN